MLAEWQRLVESLFSSAASLAGRTEVPRQLQEAMERQLELIGEVIERERELRRELANLVVAPVDAALDLMERGGETMRRQAESMEAAGRALEETAALMKDQAELFARTVGALRKPAELARSTAGLGGAEGKGSGRSGN